MRRKEAIAIALSAIVAVAILIGIFFIDNGWRTAQDVAPEDHDLVSTDPTDPQDPVPSAVGSIDEP